MKYKKTFGILVKSFLMLIVIGLFSNSTFGETISVFYKLTIPQHEFAANDIKTALELKDFNVEFKDLSTLTNSYEGKKVVIALASNADVIALLESEGDSAATGLGEQAYALRTTTTPLPPLPPTTTPGSQEK